MSAVTPAALQERYPELASSLDSAGLESLLDAFEVHDAAPGEALVAEGTPMNDLFLVWEGELDITRHTPVGERPLARVGPGSYFGVVSLLEAGPATARVATEQGCVALRLSSERFDELRRAHPEVAAPLLIEVLRSLASLMRVETLRLQSLYGADG